MFLSYLFSSTTSQNHQQTTTLHHHYSPSSPPQKTIFNQQTHTKKKKKPFTHPTPPQAHHYTHFEATHSQSEATKAITHSPMPTNNPQPKIQDRQAILLASHPPTQGRSSQILIRTTTK